MPWRLPRRNRNLENISGLVLIEHAQSNPLGRRVIAAILICSTCLAILATGAQLVFDYYQGVSGIDARLDEVEHAYAESIATSMWTMDEQQTRKQIEGIARLPDVMTAELRDPADKFLMRAGVPLSSVAAANTIRRQIPVKFTEPGTMGNKVQVATLEITASIDGVYAELRNKVLLILVMQMTKTAIVVLFTLFIFRRLVSRHLSSIAAYAQRLDLNRLGETLKLHRQSTPDPDELDIVVNAFNDMTASIRRDVDELALYRQGLERLVEARTVELAQQVTEREDAIRRLNVEMTERLHAEQTARENEDRYRQVVEMSPDAITIERDGRIIFVNRGTLNLLGARNEEQVKAVTLLDMAPPEEQPLMRRQLEAILPSGGEPRSFEVKMRRFDGTQIDVEIRRAIFQYDRTPAIQTVIHDITHRKSYEEQLRRQALHDALTGLPNRLLLLDRMEQAIAAAERAGSTVHVMFFDLDRFKCVNDTLGHDAGDELLKTITHRMSLCARKSDTLARLGGDEFVLMLEGVDCEDTVHRLVERLMTTICEPVVLGGQDVAVTCSIGISVYPHDAGEAGTLLKYADAAMYHAKEKGRNGVERYTAELHKRANEHFVMEAHLRRALERNEFRLVYQPLLDLRSGHIAGAEALIRWQHPQLGLLTPVRFISLAEETGLINGIGEWVIRTACLQAKAWMDAGVSNLPVSVNLSTQQLTRAHFDAEVASVLKNSDLPAHSLELEITESASMRNPERTVQLLHTLAAMGVGIAIDDFGTGYSNLSYLKRFPVRRLKLDRSFISDISTSATDAALTQSIIGMAHSLGLAVVAEGVEDVHQLRQLVAYGCDYLQGYYFSPPVAAESLLAMVRAGRSIDMRSLDVTEVTVSV